MKAHLVGRVVALGTLLGGIGALVIGVSTAHGAVIVGRGMVHGVPAAGSSGTGVDVLATIVLALVVGAVVWAVMADRRLTTSQAAVNAAAPLHGPQASEDEEPEETRKAA